VTTFRERIEKAAARNRSRLCIGLDPDPTKMPDRFKNGPDGVRAFLFSIVEATGDLVCAFKPNAAFYEAMGAEGWSLLAETIAEAKKRAPVVLDAKRGDVGHTSGAYAVAVFDVLGADAVTLSPYLGADGVRPFLSDPTRGVFVLCATSNPLADELQSLDAGGEPLYLRVARLGVSWDPDDRVGFVAGATNPERIAKIRERVGARLLLVPGVGAQGGDLERAVAAARTDDGGFVLNASRSVLYASPGGDFVDAARSAAERLRVSINDALETGA
jgi:orotidine-5'-phosphate decarboxylase